MALVTRAIAMRFGIICEMPCGICLHLLVTQHFCGFGYPTLLWVGGIYVVRVLRQWCGSLPPDGRSYDTFLMEGSQNLSKFRSMGRDVTYLDLWMTSFSKKIQKSQPAPLLRQTLGTFLQFFC